MALPNLDEIRLAGTKAMLLLRVDPRSRTLVTRLAVVYDVKMGP